MPLLPALFCSPHGILAISVGGKRIGPVDPKPFIDQMKSPEAPCLRISVVLHVFMYFIYLLVRLRGVFLQDDGASAFRGPLPYRHMLMYISEDDEGAPPFSRVGNTPPCDPLPAGSQHQETPRFPFGGPWRAPTPAPVPTFVRVCPSQKKEAGAPPALTGLHTRGGPALFWLRWICQRLCGCPDPPFAAFASIELKYVKELLD